MRYIFRGWSDLEGITCKRQSPCRKFEVAGLASCVGPACRPRCPAQWTHRTGHHCGCQDMWLMQHIQRDCSENQEQACNRHDTLFSTKLRLQGNNCLCNWEGNKVSSRCEIDFDLICLATALLSTASCWWLCSDDNGRYLPGDWITGPSGTSLYNTPATQWRQPAPITSCWLKQAPLWIIHLFPHLKLVWFNWIFCATSYNVVLLHICKRLKRPTFYE